MTGAALKFSSGETCASSKVAITGGAIRRPSWHWRALSMFKRRTALATGWLWGQPHPTGGIIHR